MSRFALILLLVGCGSPSVDRRTTPRPSDDPLATLAAQWEARGMEVLREGDAFVEPGGRWTSAVRVGPECTVVVAHSSSGIDDLDAVLYSPEGEVLAEDVEPDARPILRYCGPARRAYYVAHAYAGAGTFRFAMARGTREDMDWIADAMGGAPPIGGASNATLERTLRERGFDRVVDRRRIQLVDGEDVRFPIALREHECVTVLATGSSLVSLRLESEAGRIEESAGQESGVQVCDVREAVGVVRGRGLADVLVVAGASSDVGGASALWMGAERAAHVDVEDSTSAEVWALEPAEAREVRTTGCRLFEAWVEEGGATLTLRSGGRMMASGRHVRGQVCEHGVLVTNAPARARWRWRD